MMGVKVEQAARFMEAAGADIVALQEVVSHEGLSIQEHQASYLADRLG